MSCLLTGTMVSAIFNKEIDESLYTSEAERSQQLRAERPPVAAIHAAGTYILKIENSNSNFGSNSSSSSSGKDAANQNRIVRIDFVFFAKLVPCSSETIEL
jgi:hypothetical protein